MLKLWEKDGDRYVDLINSELRNLEKDLLNDKVAMSISERKDNEISTQLREKGNKEFDLERYDTAKAFYDKSLKFAETGTKNVALAYSNRSASFFKMQMYKETLVDIELATNENLPADVAKKLQNRKTESIALLPTCEQPSEHLCGLNYKPDKNFPSMANVVEIKYNEEFGRHLVAASDIPVDRMILYEDQYIKNMIDESVILCETCWTENTNFIPCTQCSSVLFCSNDCMNRNQFHKYECREGIRRGFKFLNYSIFLAIEAFEDVTDLMAFVEEVLLEPPDKLPPSLHDSKSKYHLFFKLAITGITLFHPLLRAHTHFTTLMKVVKIAILFETEEKRRFLMHLIVHHYLVLNSNVFANEKAESLYMLTSLFNHSCEPNISNRYNRNYMHCKTIKPVKKGDQLFISYIDNLNASTAERQNELKRLWNYICECPKCRSTDEIRDNPAVSANPQF